MTIKNTAPREYHGPRSFRHQGLLILYIGAGKGKTTAAVGAVLRSLGRGLNVAVVQFIKGPWISGEIPALKKFGHQVTYYSSGEGFTWQTKSPKKDVQLARNVWNVCRRLLRQRKHDVYLFDELLYTLQYKFLPQGEVKNVLRRRDPRAHVILTGRESPPWLITMADLVTEMKEVKHPFHRGILAQPGIDY